MHVIRAIVLAAALGGCGQTDGDAVSLDVTVDSSGGFPVVRSSGAPVRWRSELIATVGADTGGPYEFGVVYSVLLDARGSLWVLDGANRQLIAFDPQGRFKALWGTRGRGPGEYVGPLSIAMLHDSVALFDRPNMGKIMVFAPSGEWVREWPIAAPTGPMGVMLYRMPPDGFWTHTAFVAEVGIRSVFIRHGSSGATDTVDYRRPEVPRFPPITCDANGGFTWYSVPFGPQGMVRPLRSGEQATLVNSAYRISVLARNGDTVRVIERDVAPSPIGDAEWDAEQAKFREWREGRGNPKCTRDSFDRPPARPIVEAIFTDDEDRLWVESYSPSGPVYEIFGADGVPVARVTGLPASGGVDPSVVAGRIALYAPDSNDVPRVQVFRLRK